MFKKPILIGLAALLSTIAANAGAIGPNCGTCFGGTNSLDGYMLSSSGGIETWRFTYTLPTQNRGVGNATNISSIAAKVTSGLISASTVANPGGGTWSNPRIGSGLNGSGCSGSGSGWVCIAWSNGSSLTGPRAPARYSWVFDVKMASGSLLTNPTIKTDYNQANGNVLPEGISVPEGGNPLELPLLFSGLCGWLFYSRHRTKSGIEG